MTLATHHFAATGAVLPPVVLLHGFASSAAEDFLRTGWPQHVQSAGRSVIAIDLPGHGESPSVASVAEAHTGAVIAAILEAVDAVAPGQDIDVIGYSLGARLAWDLPAASPRVRRLVLGGLSPVEPFAAVDQAELQATLSGAAPVTQLVGMMAGMITAPGRDTASLVQVIAGLAAQPFAPETSKPGVPTLLACGADDQLTQGTEALVALLPAGEFVRVPGDHRAALDSAEFRAAAVKFLAR